MVLGKWLLLRYITWGLATVGKAKSRCFYVDKKQFCQPLEFGAGVPPKLAIRWGNIKWPRLLQEALRVKGLKTRESKKISYLGKDK